MDTFKITTKTDTKEVKGTLVADTAFGVYSEYRGEWILTHLLTGCSCGRTTTKRDAVFLANESQKQADAKKLKTTDAAVVGTAFPKSWAAFISYRAAGQSYDDWAVVNVA